MARSNDYDSSSPRLFIVHEDSTHLDRQFVVFENVAESCVMRSQLYDEAFTKNTSIL